MKPNFLFTIQASALLLTYALCGCTKSEEKKQDDNLVIYEQTQTIADVDTTMLRRQTFNNQLLCNGRLSAIGKAVLLMPRQDDALIAIMVHNGQHVQKGSLLAMADTTARKADLKRAENDFDRARVELQDKLISLGYDVQTTDAEEWARVVPKDLLHRAQLTSGYLNAQHQLTAARKAVSDCRLTAPFSGRVADVEGHLHQPCSRFCTLLDDSFFEVEFKILEAELAFVRLGQTVQITPFVYKEKNLSGTISEINPSIDERGLVKVKARIKNSSAELMDGMNVRVIVESQVPDMLVVPKEAVVERDGYNVVFMYDTTNHRAVWTYVDILHSNLDSHAISGCERKKTQVNEGDIVITSGNLNLADDTEVRIK